MRESKRQEEKVDGGWNRLVFTVDTAGNGPQEGSMSNGRRDDWWNLVQCCLTRRQRQPGSSVLQRVQAVSAIPVQPGSLSTVDEADEDLPEEWCYD